MPEPSVWIPLRWPAGWRDPGFLKLLQNTLLNCLIIDWNPSEERAAFLPLIHEARRRGLDVIGLMDTMDAMAEAVAMARIAGLATLLVPAPVTPIDFPVIPFTDRSRVRSSDSGSILAIRGNVWPGIRGKVLSGGNSVEAGPTGIPWVDANGWFVRIARALSPDKIIWIFADPPAKEGTFTADSYLCAIADAAAAGGRWVISLGAQFANNLAAGNPHFLQAWKRLMGALSFFENHKQWRNQYKEIGRLAVLSDFSGANEFLSIEVVNLLSRRHLPFRILDKTNPLNASFQFQDLQAILYPDEEPPQPAVRRTLTTWIESGGVLICPVWIKGLGLEQQLSGQRYARFQVYSLGKGRVAVAREQETDPYVIAADTHTIFGRAHDLLRAWNAGTINSLCLTSFKGRSCLIQLVNYYNQTAKDVCLQVCDLYRSARLWLLEQTRPVPLRLSIGRGTTEIQLPPLPAYAAVELEK